MVMDTIKKPKQKSLLPLLLTFTGLALMTYMMFEESEPGAVPLLLTATGLIWYVITKAHQRSV